MSETTDQPVEVYVAGVDQAEAAKLLLGAADDLGHDPAVVQTISGGFLVPRDVAEKAGALDAEVDSNPEATEDAEDVVGETTPFQAGPDTPTLQGVPGEPADTEETSEAEPATEATEDAEDVEEEPVELKGEALEAALRERGLPTSGTADEKRARVAEHDRTQQ